VRGRAELHARIAERTQVVERLDLEVSKADAHLGRVAREEQATRETWEASHAAVLDRGAAAVHELQRREAELLDSYLQDTPQHLLEVIGSPPLTRPASGPGGSRHARPSGRAPPASR
jgi:hypothetical protein